MSSSRSATFLEDVAIFTAQQRSPTLHPNAPKVDINAVSGVIQAHRTIDRLHAEQQVAQGRVVTAERRRVDASHSIRKV
jgi:hypothetical protein